ncbi:hypothetical protein ACQXVK_04140 [Curtobacterium sp. AB451]|uniref:hypothetical protein n=1 Tax=unclassified Curtobacterium TaxID=257496 RepID=UPI003A808DB6
MKIASVAVVAALFVAALVAGCVSDVLPAGSASGQRLSALSMIGMGLTLALGLAVGYFWLFRSDAPNGRSRDR